MFACAKACGVTDPPSTETLLEYSSYIQRRFGELNASEINEAFDLFCAQKLDFQKDYVHEFNSLFIGNVLSAYIRYKEQMIIQAKNAPKPKPAQKSEEEVKSEQQQRSELHQKAMAVFEELLFPQFILYKKSKIYKWTELDEKILFQYLEAIKVIDLTTQEKIDFASDMEKKLRLEISYLVKQKLARFDNKTSSFVIEPFFLKKRCQSEMVKRWIMEAEMTDENIVQLINDKLNQK